MTTNELVSVIVPTYYRNQYLRECLQSVLEQDYRPIEIIVVDDSGEAHAKEVVDEFEDVRYVALDQNRGAQAARNRGFRHASGAHVQFLDDDDRLTCDKIQKQVDLLQKSPEIGVVSCGVKYESGWVEIPPDLARSRPLEEALSFNNLWRYSTLLIRYSTLLDIMPLDERAEGAGDAKLGIELARRTGYDFVDAPLVLGGEPERRLGKSWEALEALRRMMTEYEQLYDEVDPTVKRQACADINSLEGHLRLQESVWSAAAITAHAKAVHFSPRPQKLMRFLNLLASLFGRHGVQIGSLILRRARAFRNDAMATDSNKNGHKRESDSIL